MKILGIDPGSVSAAYGFIDVGSGVAFVGDLPVVNANINSPELSRLLGVYSPDIVIVEEVHSMPQQGVASTFAFGRGVGRIEGVVAASGFSFEYVLPQVWKRYYKLPGGPKNKDKARARAIQLFPDVGGLSRAKDGNRAEALLIAKWFAETRK